MADSFFALEKRKTNLDGTDTLGYVCKFTLEPPRVPPVHIPPYVDTSPIPVSDPTIPTYGIWDWWEDVLSANVDFRPIYLFHMYNYNGPYRGLCMVFYMEGGILAKGQEIKSMDMPCRAIWSYFNIPYGGNDFFIPPGLPDIGSPL